MRVKATYVGDKPGKPKAPNQHPRSELDSMLVKNYPGKNLEDLDTHNVPVIPGKEDTPEMRALRKGHKPSVDVGQRTPINNMKKP